MKKLIAVMAIAVALVLAAPAMAIDFGAVDPGETLVVRCYMPGKNAHVYTPPFWGSQELDLEGYFPGSDSWVEYWGLNVPKWHAQVNSENLTGIMPGSTSIKTTVYNDGERRVRFSGTCTIYPPKHRR